jgi:hypothetical protein
MKQYKVNIPVLENQNPVQGYFFEIFSIPDRECRKEAIWYGRDSSVLKVLKFLQIMKICGSSAKSSNNFEFKIAMLR